MSDQSEKSIVLPAPLTDTSQNNFDPERRIQIRYPFMATAELYDVRSQTRIVGRCSDLSLGGCYVDTLSPLLSGSSVRIRIKHGSREFEATGTVCYSHISMGMGVKFTQIKKEYQNVLLSWIADLSGGQPPMPEAPAKEPEAVPQQDLSSSNIRLVLNELINLLVRKQILSEKESAALLHQLFR
jgi:hypothetical protein